MFLHDYDLLACELSTVRTHALNTFDVLCLSCIFLGQPCVLLLDADARGCVLRSSDLDDSAVSATIEDLHSRTTHAKSRV